MSLNRLIQENKLKFFFHVTSIADINTARGFIEMFSLQKKSIVIGYSREASRKVARKILKGCAFITTPKKPRNCFHIQFHNEEDLRLSRNGLIVNYIPYKYCLPVHVLPKERAVIRRAMRIDKERKVIVTSSSGRDEVEVILKAYQGLRYIPQPLLILGMRKPDLLLASVLKKKGLKVLDRRSKKQSLSRFGKFDIIVLNTMGELFEFLKIANLVIVGHDRNIFEPALLSVPVLYFGGPVNMSEKERKLAKLFNLVWRKNRVAKKLLDKFGASAQIRRDIFFQQIDHILCDPGPMIRGARRAVGAFGRHIVPSSRSRATLALVKAIARFKLFKGKTRRYPRLLTDQR